MTADWVNGAIDMPQVTKPEKRVIVCGGRSFKDWYSLNDVLSVLAERYEITCIIEGDAPGADRLAGLWARGHGIENEKYPADWRKFGKRAGPLRNTHMLRTSGVDLLVAFPGGHGTADCVRKAKAAGIEVISIAHNGMLEDANDEF